VAVAYFQPKPSHTTQDWLVLISVPPKQLLVWELRNVLEIFSREKSRRETNWHRSLVSQHLSAPHPQIHLDDSDAEDNTDLQHHFNDFFEGKGEAQNIWREIYQNIQNYQKFIKVIKDNIPPATPPLHWDSFPFERSR